jgi:hypothetical protein
MMIIGCDPGLTGAMALIDPARGLLDVMDLPVCASGQATGRMQQWLDCEAIRAGLCVWSEKYSFASDSIHPVIEKPIPMPTLNASTIAAQFDAFGVLRALLSRLGKVEAVPPVEWKRMYGFGKDKDQARSTCLSLYPNAPITLVKHHNRAEAVLIGHWHLRKVHG